MKHFLFFSNKKFLEQLSRDSMFQDYRLMIENKDGSIVDLDQLSSGEREIIAFLQLYVLVNMILKY
jgi:hypothetical protein